MTTEKIICKGREKAPTAIEHIEQTPWAKNFKAKAKFDYPEALAIALELSNGSGKVSLQRRDDHSSAGDYLWAIIPDSHPDFWLEALEDKQAAIGLCRQMGWSTKTFIASSSKDD